MPAKSKSKPLSLYERQKRWRLKHPEVYAILNRHMVRRHREKRKMQQALRSLATSQAS